MIGRFPIWGDIELQDQDTFADFYSREQPVISELSFQNLFVWRHSRGFKATILDNALCVMTTNSDVPFALPPIAASDAPVVIAELFNYMRTEGLQPCLRRVPHQFVNRLRDEHVPEPDRDNSDYVYLAADLIDLAGRKYHKKRNLIAQFTSKFQYEYRRITPDILPQCAQLQAAWCDVRGCFTPENVSLAEEDQALREAFRSCDALGLIGGAILINGKVEAFTIGGRLNADTFVIHFEKGNPSFPGIYQVVNQAFCADACVGYKFVNREQDLGDPGLRQAKESYYPHHMIDKYNIKPRE